MKLTTEQMQKVAKLANLSITSEEEELYCEQLSKILEYVEQIEAVDTSGVEPTFNVSLNINITRLDKESTSITQNEVLSNAKESKDGYILTPGVFDSE